MEYKKNITTNVSLQMQHYRAYLHEIFSATETYEGFISTINKELYTRFEVIDWAYSFLNLPDKLVIMENFGTRISDYINEYIEQGWYEHDLILDHVRSKNTSVFQSDLVNAIEHLNGNGFEFNNTLNYKRLVKNNKKHGYKEICCMSITSSIDGNRCLFSVTTQGIKCDSNKFKQKINHKLNYLQTLGLAINDIGFRLYKNDFVKALKQHNFIANSQPLNLLATMGKYDLDIAEGAQRMGIKYNTAKNHIVKIKLALGATTIHGAYERAIRSGLIM